MANRISVLEGAMEIILAAGAGRVTVRFNPSVRVSCAVVGTVVGAGVAAGAAGEQAASSRLRVVSTTQ
jgi:hypothetical protein